MRRRTKIKLIIVFVVFLGLLAAAPYWVPVSIYKPEVEAQLTHLIGRPVTVGELRLILIPVPFLAARNVRVQTPTGGADAQVSSIEVHPDLINLVERRLVIRSIDFRGLKITSAFVSALAGQFKGAGSGGSPVSVHRVSAWPLTITLGGGQRLGPYRADADIGPTGHLETVSVRRTDGTVSLKMAATGGGYTLHLTARDWTPSLGPSLRFDTLQADGRLRSDGLSIAKLDAHLYGGTVHGAGELAWSDGWQAHGNLQAEGVQAEPLLAALQDSRPLSGVLKFSGKFKSQAPTPAQLLDEPVTTGAFDFRDGEIQRMDLREAATHFVKEGFTGGTTPFQRLQGDYATKGRNIVLTNLRLISDVLEGNGDLTISGPEHKLHGNFTVGIRKTGGLISVPLKVWGTVKEPWARPTNEALVSGAIGTAVLGPGLGTAAGIKAGKVIHKMFDIFRGDKKKDEKAAEKPQSGDTPVPPSAPSP